MINEVEEALLINDDEFNLEIPIEELSSWQTIVDLACTVTGAALVRILKTEGPFERVLVQSPPPSTETNQAVVEEEVLLKEGYYRNEKADRTVFRKPFLQEEPPSFGLVDCITFEKLPFIPQVSGKPANCIRYPLFWPDKSGFGIFEIVGCQESSLSSTQLRLLEHFQEAVNTKLSVLEQTWTLETLSKTTNDGIWEWDFLKHQFKANPRTLEIFGNSQLSALSLPGDFDHCLDPDEKPEIIKALETHIKDNSPFEMELRSQRQDGEFNWLFVRGQVIRSSGGQPLRMLGKVSDITKQKLDEQELYFIRNRMRLMLENFPILLFALNCEGILTWVEGDKILKASRLNPENLAGRSIFDLFPANGELQTYFKRALNGETLSFILKRKKLALEVDFTPLLDKKGNVKGITGIAADISDRLIMEEQNRKNQEIYRQMFQETPAIQTLINIGTEKFVDINKAACQFYGYSKEEFFSLKLNQIYNHPEEELSRKINEAAGINGSHSIVQHRLANGEIRTVEIYNSPLDLNGEPLLFGIVHDITERIRAERELQAEHAFALQIMKNMGQGLTVTDLDARFEYVNSAYASMLGYSPEELIGKTVYDLTPADERGKVLEATAKCIKGESFIFEKHLLKRDGGQLYVTLTSTPRWRDGKICGAVTVITDLTERQKEVEERRRQNEYLAAWHETSLALLNRLDLTDLLQAIINRAVSLVGTDNGFIYILEEESNPVVMSVVVGTGIFRDRIGFKISSGSGMCGKVWEEGKPLVVDNYSTYPGRLDILKDDPYHAVAAFPLKSGKQVIGVIGLTFFEEGRVFEEKEVNLLIGLAQLASMALDNARLYSDSQRRLTELISVERVARTINSTLNLEQVFQNIVEQISSTCGYEMVSIYLRVEDEIILQHYVGYDYVISKLEIGRGVIGRVIQTGQPIFVRDASKVPDFLYAMDKINQGIYIPLKSKDGPVIGSLAIESKGQPKLLEGDFNLLNLLADQVSVAVENARLLVLERKMLETQKLESLGVLAGGIAHDFNNLLVPILGNAGFALLQLPPVSPVRETIEQIKTATQRAADLTRQMLAYSGKGSFVVTPVNLNNLVEEMVNLLKISISKKAALKLNLDPKLPLTEADPTQLRQVIMNLIVNSSDAIGEETGTITVETGLTWVDRGYLSRALYAYDLPEGDYIYLDIKDTGTGMDRATLSKIFDPFFTTKFTGRGLGLAAVLGIVRGHKGALKVESDPGQGSTFRVLFPKMKVVQALPSSPESLAQRIPSPLSQEVMVLVVDDEELVLKMTTRLLKHFGYSVLSAPDGEKAVEIYRQSSAQIDCVLLDMTMPKLNGEQTFIEMCRIRPDAKVILMSGYTEQEATKRFTGSHLAGFLQKPYTPTELVDKIEKILGK